MLQKFYTKKGHNKMVEVLEIFGKKMYIDTNDWRGRLIKQNKGTQHDKIKSLSKIIENEKIDLFIDVGGNYGEFSLAISSYGIPVICFEPNPICFELLKKTFEDIQNVTLVRAACGSNEENRKFFYNEAYSGGGSFGKGVIQNANNISGPILELETPVYRVDKYVSQNIQDYPKNILMKIDVEGFEDEVFNGTSELLSNVRWKALIETNRSAVTNAGKNYNEWYKTFSDYTVYQKFSDSDILIGN